MKTEVVRGRLLASLDTEELLFSLLRSDSEAEVIDVLHGEGLWDDLSLWRNYGDTEGNFSSAGNQQRNPEAALVEKIINSVDACLMRGCFERGIDPGSEAAPKTIREAVAIFYEGATAANVPDYQGYIAEWSSERRTQVARDICLSITGSRPEDGRAPAITIADTGEGQAPEAIPNTILSLDKDIKRNIRFVQGKFNMGGTGALRFCGRHNLQLVISKRHPDLARREGASSCWGFTIVRRDDPDENSRVSVYRYLAPVGADVHARHGDLLTVDRVALPIFPDGQAPYKRESDWGTLLKLYQYDTRFKTHLFRRGGLQERLDLYMPGLALPVRLHECRNYRGVPGSFETTLAGLQVRLAKSSNLEFEPDTGEIGVDGEAIATTLYAFKRDTAATYRKNEGVLFVMNGQTHASLRADRFFRRAKMGYLKDSLLVLLDCSELTGRTKEELFMNSRDRLADARLARKIEDELLELIERHEGLRALRQRRRQEDTATKIADDKPFEEALRAIVRRHPSLTKLFLPGAKLSNPFSQVPVNVGDRFQGKLHPTLFKFKDRPYGETLQRTCHLGQRLRLTFETDVVNDYFKRRTNAGHLKVSAKLNDRVAQIDHNLNLHNGLAHLNLQLPEDARSADILHVSVEVSDPTLVEPFKNRARVTMRPVRETAGGTGGGPRSRNEEDANGHKEMRPSGIAFPTITEVHRDKWPARKMNEYSALRIEQAGDGDDQGGPALWDFYVNVDNIFLQSEIKASRQDADLLRTKFKFGMALVGLGLLQQNRPSPNGSDGRSDTSSHSLDPEELVASATDAIAPMLLPMLEALGDLELSDIEAGVDDDSAGDDEA